MAKEVVATTPKVTSTQRVIKEPPAPQQVRIYHKSGTHQDVFPVDAKEAVATGEYTLEAPMVSMEGENVHQPIRPETVTGLMPEMGVPLADLEAGTEAEGESSVKLRGTLPDDFPGKAALDAAGLTTYAKVRKHLDKFDTEEGKVDGIGKATADKIREAMGQSSEADEE